MEYNEYELVRWPWVQELFDYSWFYEESYLLHASLELRQEHIDSAWFVPKDRLDEIRKENDFRPSE